MPRPTSPVPLRRIDLKIPVVLYQAILNAQAAQHAKGCPTTLTAIVVGALRQALHAYLPEEVSP